MKRIAYDKQVPKGISDEQAVAMEPDFADEARELAESDGYSVIGSRAQLIHHRYSIASATVPVKQVPVREFRFWLATVEVED